MSFEHDERELELATLDLLAELGWVTADASGETFPGGMFGREHPGEAVLRPRLFSAVERLNPGLSESALVEAVEQLVRLRPAASEVRNNRDVWELLRDGAKVETRAEDGSKRTMTIRFVDWDDVSTNDWLAVRQFTLTGELYKTRADIIGFVESPWLGWRL